MFVPIKGFYLNVLKPPMMIFRMSFIILGFFLPLLSIVAAAPSVDLTEAFKSLDCDNPSTPSYFDYSVKKRSHQRPVCPIVPLIPRDSSSTIDDYSCSQSKPCSNGKINKSSLYRVV